MKKFEVGDYIKVKSEFDSGHYFFSPGALYKVLRSTRIRCGTEKIKICMIYHEGGRPDKTENTVHAKYYNIVKLTEFERILLGIQE